MKRAEARMCIAARDFHRSDTTRKLVPMTSATTSRYEW